MNVRLIGFGSIVSAIIGGCLGFSMADLAYTSNPSQITNPIEEKYQRLDYNWVYIGAVSGFVIGMGQEMVRELKKDADNEEKESEKSHRNNHKFS